MALSSSQRKTIIGRGYSAEQLSQWEAENPGDEGRALAAFPTQDKPQASQSSSQSASTPTPAATPAPTSTPNPTAAIAGLTSAAPAAEGTPGGGVPNVASAPEGGSAPAAPAMAALQGLGATITGAGDSAAKQVTPDASGSAVLRQYLGTRTFPQDMSALAGLRRIY